MLEFTMYPLNYGGRLRCFSAYFHFACRKLSKRFHHSLFLHMIAVTLIA